MKDSTRYSNELKSTADIYTKAEYPYTQQLLDAIPIPDPQLSRKK